MPEGSRLDFVRPNPPATYFTCQAVEAAFSQEQQALVFTLEAQTDMDLDNADCQSFVQLFVHPHLPGENGAYQYPSYDGATWTPWPTGPRPGRTPTAARASPSPWTWPFWRNRASPAQPRATLDLVVTDTSYVGAEDPWQFFPSVEFAVELEETSAPVSFESAQEEVYYKIAQQHGLFHHRPGQLYRGAPRL